MANTQAEWIKLLPSIINFIPNKRTEDGHSFYNLMFEVPADCFLSLAINLNNWKGIEDEPSTANVCHEREIVELLATQLARMNSGNRTLDLPGNPSKVGNLVLVRRPHSPGQSPFEVK